MNINKSLKVGKIRIKSIALILGEDFSAFDCESGMSARDLVLKNSFISSYLENKLGITRYEKVSADNTYIHNRGDKYVAEFTVICPAA